MFKCAMFALLLLATSGTTPRQEQRTPRSLIARKPVASSPHCQGPGTLEGWTLLYPRPDAVTFGGPDRLPLALLVSRGGHVIRRVQGSPIIWTWFFVDDHSVAIETGPLHFGMECQLIDINSGKVSKARLHLADIALGVSRNRTQPRTTEGFLANWVNVRVADHSARIDGMSGFPAGTANSDRVSTHTRLRYPGCGAGAERQWDRGPSTRPSSQCAGSQSGRSPARLCPPLSRLGKRFCSNQ